MLNWTSLPSDIIAIVVFYRLHYRLKLRELSEILLGCWSPSATSGIHAIAYDTDDTKDGAEALLDPGSFARATGFGIGARARLADNDRYGTYCPIC